MVRVGVWQPGAGAVCLAVFRPGRVFSSVRTLPQYSGYTAILESIGKLETKASGVLK